MAVGRAHGDTGPTWTVTRTGGNPFSNAVVVQYTPTESGLWSVTVSNFGLSSINVSVFTPDWSALLFFQKQTFGDHKSQVFTTASFFVSSDSSYILAFIPYGKRGMYAVVTQNFAPDQAPVASFTFSPTPAIAGQPVTFDASASYDPDGTIASYAWDFGDGGTASGVTATHTFVSAGTYTVTLTVTDNLGAPGSTSTMITVQSATNLPPTASFTVTPASPIAGKAATFDASASSDPDGVIVSYAWDFGDGTTATVTTATTTHTYSAAGTYTVTLTVTDDGGLTGTATASVTVVPDLPPTASFSFTPASPTAGVPVSFDASASTDPDGFVVSYSWDFGDGTTATLATPTTSHTFAASGSYVVTLTVTDDGGLTATATQTLSVAPTDLPPTAAFTFSPASPNVHTTVTFDGSGSSDPDGTVVNWAWTFGDGATGSGSVASHAYTAGGTYTVTLVVTDNSGSTASTSQSVTVVDLPPVASFTFTPSAPFALEPITFDASASMDPDGSIVSYAWVFGDGSTATVAVATTTHTYSLPGTYSVSLTVTDDGGKTASASASVVAADVPPTASFTFTPAAPVAGQSITFDASASMDPDGSIASYAWDFGDGTTATVTTATTTHTYSAAGTYTVSLVVTDNGGLTASTSQSVIVGTATNIPPTAVFTFSPASPNVGTTVTFDGSGSSDPDGTVVSWAWTFGDGATGSGPTATHSYSAQGTYTVTLTVTDDGGATGTVSHTVTVTDLAPIASFTYSPANPVATHPVSFDGSGSSDPDGIITAWAWTFGDGGTATGVTTSHTYAVRGTYTVTLTVTDNGGKTGSATQSVVVTDAAPTASFTFSPSSPVATQPVTFDASASSDPDGTIVSYGWVFGDGGTATVTTKTTAHTYAHAGTYTVTLTVTDDGGMTATATQSVSVSDAPPIAAFTYTPTSPVATLPITFNGGGSSDPDGTIMSWAWTFGDGAAGTGSTATHTYAHAGTYTVTLTVTDDGGMTGTTSQSVVVTDAPPTASFTYSPASPVAASPVAFDGTPSSDPDGTITAYAWTFGDGASGSGATLSHTYAHAGTYTVTLTVTDDGGKTGSTTKSVVVTDAPPVASFTFSPPSPVGAQPVTFNGAGSFDPDGTITAYAWTFSDGGSGSGVTLSHTFAHAGTYTVTLTVTDDGGKTGSQTQSVVVTDAPPTAAFTFSPAFPLFNTPVTFDATASSDPDGTIATYAWTFGDGSTSTVTTATTTHTYAAAGTYTVTLTVTDDGGMTATVSHAVTVVSDIPPIAKLAVPRTLMTVSASGAGSSDPDGTVMGYAFDWGDGTSTTGSSPTASHTYSVPGPYTITLTVTDNGGQTGTTTNQTSVGPSTLDYTYDNFYNVPWGEWWDLRTNAGYGDEPIGASCFTQVAVNDGTCTTNVAGIPRVAAYPYEDWLGPAGTSAIYAPFRLRVTGANVGGYNLSEPVFLPVFNYAKNPGTQLSFNWNMQYLDVATYNTLTSKAVGCFGTANKNDGYILQTKLYITLDAQESARIFGAATGSQSAIQTWWNTNTNNACGTVGALEKSVNDWFSGEGNGKYDIYNGYDGAYFPLYTNITAVVQPNGVTNVYIEHGAWGTEVLLDRWFYWGNASFVSNYLDSTTAKGWWGMENGYWDNFHYAGQLTPTAMYFNLSGVPQYLFQERSAPGPDGVYKNSTNLGDTDDVPVWTWGPSLVDYGVFSPQHKDSEIARYAGLKYFKTTPGSGDYGTNTSFDFTPIAWVPKAGEIWHFLFPPGNIAYQNPATATLGTTLPNTQLPSITSNLNLWKTATANFGTWTASAATWDVYGGTSEPWPTGAPGSYTYIPLPSIYFVPANTNPGNGVVMGVGQPVSTGAPAAAPAATASPPAATVTVSSLAWASTLLAPRAALDIRRTVL